MKLPKISLKQSLLIISFIVFSLSNACTQSNSDTSTNTETMVAKPEMDIYTAVLMGNLEVVKQHIKAQTNINEKEAMTGATPLISAATFGKNEIVQELIDAGADLNIKNNDGSTALHTAAFFCRVEIVQMLIDAKADKEIRNNFNATPRESVMGPFEGIRPVYEMLQQQLEPIGLQIDLAEIEKTRPVIAMMLQ